MRKWRIAKEARRACDGCPFVGEVYYVAIGGKAVRLCIACFEALNRLRIRLVTENLDDLETVR